MCISLWSWDCVSTCVGFIRKIKATQKHHTPNENYNPKKYYKNKTKIKMRNNQEKNWLLVKNIVQWTVKS